MTWDDINEAVQQSAHGQLKLSQVIVEVQQDNIRLKESAEAYLTAYHSIIHAAKEAGLEWVPATATEIGHFIKSEL